MSYRDVAISSIQLHHYHSGDGHRQSRTQRHAIVFAMTINEQDAQVSLYVKGFGAAAVRESITAAMKNFADY